MTKEELEKVVQGAEYDFLRENPHLGSNIMFLTLVVRRRRTMCTLRPAKMGSSKSGRSRFRQSSRI